MYEGGTNIDIFLFRNFMGMFVVNISSTTMTMSMSMVMKCATHSINEKKNQVEIIHKSSKAPIVLNKTRERQINSQFRKEGDSKKYFIHLHDINKNSYSTGDQHNLSIQLKVSFHNSQYS